MITISHPSKIINTVVDLPASKSISNRMLIIQFLMQQTIELENLSNCNDTNDLKRALEKIKAGTVEGSTENTIVDVGEAGTSYRFVTALLAVIHGNYELRGSDKLMKRPMESLLNALTSLGAKINSNNGQGPIFISGGSIGGGNISIDASTSSQFISALLMVAPYFKNGLTIELKGKIVSLTYIKMTINLMKLFGAKVAFHGQTINVEYSPYYTHLKTYTIEADWTAASYWYAFAVLSRSCNVTLKGLKENSLQGDSLLYHLFKIYGIQSNYTDVGLRLTKHTHEGFVYMYDFIDEPDLVQTFTFLNAAMACPLQVNNAANLIHKETNRIEAIATELQKIGAKLIKISDDDFYIENQKPYLNEQDVFETYHDHRMAMSAAILAMVFNNVKISNEQVVAKSYPAFWKHLAEAGFETQYE